MRPIRLLDLGGLPPVHTQAVYHLLAQRMTVDAPDTVVLTWPTSPYLCLGFHQRMDAVLDPAAIERLPVVRRRVGGGLTYLDGDQVFYQYIFHHSRVPPVPAALYRQLLAPPILAMRALGVPAELRGVNEIEVGERRIAGIGGARIDEASVVVGNVLLDFDFEALCALWRAPTVGFGELARDALSARLTTLRREGIGANRGEVVQALSEAVQAHMGRPVELGDLSQEEQQGLDACAAQLTAPEFLRDPDERPAGPLRLKVSARAYVQQVEARLGRWQVRGALLLRDGRVVRARLESTPQRDWAEVEAGLVGASEATWLDVLREA